MKKPASQNPSFNALMLDNEQRQKLREALIKAFPTKFDLEILLHDRLNIQLNTITSGSNHTESMFDVVKWFNSQGRIGELIHAAKRANSRNPELQEFIEEIGLSEQKDLSTTNTQHITKDSTNETPHNLRFTSPVEFLGRANELKHLHQMLQRNDPVVIAAIEGMGGVGKTELAMQYAWCHLKQGTYPGGICWLTATAQNIGDEVVNFAKTKLNLKLPENLDLPEDQVRFCWGNWKNSRKGNVLVILDDVKDYRKVQQDLPPQASQFKVLITTRLQLQFPQTSLTLKVLEEEAALELLGKWVGEKRILQESADARKLCKRLDYLPLALQLVGRYVQKQKLSLAEMLGQLDEKGLRHESLLIDQNGRTRILNAQRGVAAAFELSWDELSDEAKELGCLLSLFALAPIPRSLVESGDTGQDTELLRKAGLELEELHLIQREQTYLLHQLIREFFQDKLTQLEQKDTLQRLFFQVMVVGAKKVPELLTQQNIQEIAPVIPHFAEMVKNKNMLNNNSIIKDEDFCLPFKILGRFYESQGFYQQGFYQEAEISYRDYLSNAKERFGDEHIEVASSLNSLALIYLNMGRYSEAKPLFEEALQLSQRLLGETHSDVATILNNLGLLYCNERRFREAEPFFKKALRIRKQCLINHLDVATILNNLAYLSSSLANFEEAESLLKQALEIRKQYLEENHPDLAATLNNLAHVYGNQKRYSRAKSLYEQALEMTKNIFGENHPDVAQTLNNIGVIYAKQNQYKKALDILEKALNMLEDSLGPRHPLTVYTQTNIINIREDLAEINLFRKLFIFLKDSYRIFFQ